MDNLVYLALQSQATIDESIQSINSFFYVESQKIQSQTNIIIYTDNPNAYKKLQEKSHNIVIEYIDDKTYSEWIGEDFYLFRCKIQAIIHCLNKYKLPVLFVDTDTMFLDSIENIFKAIQNNENIYLYYPENTFCKKAEWINNSQDEVSKPLYRSIQKDKKIICENYTYYIEDDLPQWNSGVIGLNPYNINLLKQALALSDYIYKKYHIRVAEQIAISFVFQLAKGKKLFAADQYIFHYYYFKEARYLLENFFGNSLYQNLVQFTNPQIVQFIKDNEIKYQSYEDLLFSIICIIRKKWKSKEKNLEKDMETDTLMKKMFFDINLYNDALHTIEKKYKITLS